MVVNSSGLCHDDFLNAFFEKLRLLQAYSRDGQVGIDAGGLLKGGNRVVEVAEHAGVFESQQHLILRIVRLQANGGLKFLKGRLGLVASAQQSAQRAMRQCIVGSYANRLASLYQCLIELRIPRVSLREIEVRQLAVR